MNPLLRWLTSPEWAHTVTALLHSLWQGALVALVLALLMRRLTNPLIRYCCALSALGVIVIAGLVTWGILNAPTTTPTTISPAANDLAAAPVTVEAFAPSPANKIVVVAPLAQPTAPTNWTTWLALLWMTGAMAMLLRAGIKVAGAEKLRRSCQPLADESIAILVTEACRAVGLARKIRVAVTDKLTSPAVVGVIVPTLILPLSLFTTLTPTQIQFILLHELAHIRRGDYLANLFQLFAEALLFFNPAVWWISHQIRREREACCDALAIELSGAPAEYARTLVHVAENILQPAPAAAPAFGNDSCHPSSLADRVQRLLVPGYRPALRLTWRAMLTSLLVGTTLLVLSAVGTRNTVGAILASTQSATNNPAVSRHELNSSAIDAAVTNAAKIEPLLTRQFDLPWELVRKHIATNLDQAELDRALANTNYTVISESIRNWIQQAGVNLDPQLGKTVFYNARAHKGLLLVRATRNELDTIETTLRELIPPTPLSPSRTFQVDPEAMAQAIGNVMPQFKTNLEAGTHSFFKTLGVDLSPPKSIHYNSRTGELFVSAPDEDLKTVEQVTKVLNIEPPQVNLKVRWVEIPASLVGELVWPALTNMLPRAPSLPTMSANFANRTAVLKTAVLSREAMEQTLSRLMVRGEIKLLSDSQITTLSGRQAQIQLVQTNTIAATGTNPQALIPPGITSGTAVFEQQSIPLGPVFDVLPQVNSNHTEVSLLIYASSTEFLGYEKTSATTNVYINGQKQTIAMPFAKFRTYGTTNSSILQDGQTLVLGHLTTTEITTKPDGTQAVKDVTEMQTNILYIFITATLLDPAGNPLAPTRKPFNEDLGIPSRLIFGP